MGRALFGRQSFTGRGALSNPPGRFDLQHLERVDDGWYVEESPESIATTLTPEHAREIISTNDSPDIPFEQSINPYRGCSHGCIYCYARPSHAYMGLSPGLDFETRLFYKVDAAALLEKQLARPGYVCKPITLGANTDPYQPSERHMKVTRSILEVLLRTRHPVTVITKGALVMRDLTRPAAQAHARAAHRVPARAPARAARAECGRRALWCIGGPGHSGDQRSRDRVYSRGLRAGRHRLGRLRAAATALRDQGPVPRVARRALSATRRARHVAHPGHARRPR